MLCSSHPEKAWFHWSSPGVLVAPDLVRVTPPPPAPQRTASPCVSLHPLYPSRHHYATWLCFESRTASLLHTGRHSTFLLHLRHHPAFLLRFGCCSASSLCLKYRFISLLCLGCRSSPLHCGVHCSLLLLHGWCPFLLVTLTLILIPLTLTLNLGFHSPLDLSCGHRSNPVLCLRGHGTHPTTHIRPCPMLASPDLQVATMDYTTLTPYSLPKPAMSPVFYVHMCLVQSC